MNLHYGVLLLSAVLTACNGAASIPVASPQSNSLAPPLTLHLITYGQSLSLGARAVNDYPTDLSIPSDDQQVGMMFKGGTRPDDLSGLVDFQESNAPVDLDEWNIAPTGETPLYGALLELKDLPGMRIGSAAGRGGNDIVSLSRGTMPYRRLLSQVRAARSLVEGSYGVSLIWMQGEADSGNANYASEFEQLVLDLDADVRAIAPQGTIQFYVCLPAVPDVAAAQRAVAAALPQVHIVCDTATLAKSDGVHLTAASSRQAGQMLGKAIAELSK
jgi:hypothetical protein